MYPAADVERARVLREAGRSLGQVAYLLRVGRSTVANWERQGFRVSCRRRASRKSSGAVG
jgi:predicted transcriptional regulator